NGGKPASSPAAAPAGPDDPPLPRHVAIIMDGNGRWATARGLDRALGHQAGAEAVRRVVTAARQRGIPYLTLYAFSTENWSRPAEEVEALMALLLSFLQSELPTMLDNGVKLRILGDMDRLSVKLRQQIAVTCKATDRCNDMVLSLAVNYGGRDEIVRAVQKAARALATDVDGSLVGLDAASFAAYLDTATMPDPDMVIRTAGEKRLSNFLVWQSAYAELFFTETLWPDFSDTHLEEALADYAGRVRKFGNV
ncbi:MAG: di-trans,poly-cis-decaprenylcistransferase, partial [Planctomycetaceae bacterium]|nr:di-trans,poly-cis-decaprenylcistransferase [Planctomycetaceae bacterium]